MFLYLTQEFYEEETFKLPLLRNRQVNVVAKRLRALLGIIYTKPISYIVSFSELNSIQILNLDILSSA